MNETILLVGCGAMGIEYAKVLKKMNRKFLVVGRSEKSAQNFEKVTGINTASGGIKNWLEKNNCPKWAIVAVTENNLGMVTLELMGYGAKNILVEKPGAGDYDEIKEIAIQAKKRKASVFVAYNRRFYASVSKARDIIKNDGGVLSFSFEFTELSEIIKKLIKAPGVKENWFFNNSTHIIDLAFFLGGKPKKILSFVAGGLRWHKSGSIYSGAGITTKGALFSYQANWEAPGRWGLEIMTKKHRLIFRPLEKLQIQDSGSFNFREAVIDDRYDKEFKPGIFKQVEAFLNKNVLDLCSIREQSDNIKFYKKIERI